MVLPKGMHPEFAEVIQRICDDRGTEVGPETIWTAFRHEYLENTGPLALQRCIITATEGDDASRSIVVEAVIARDGAPETVRGSGNGPVDAFVDGLRKAGLDFRVMNYSEHALSSGSDSKAAAYVEVGSGSETCWGVGIDESIDVASFKAIISGINRTIRGRQLEQGQDCRRR